MLAVYTPRGSALMRKQVEADIALPENALWIDLELPTPSEDKAVEDALGISVPTLREMQEIEITSRLYVENGARYMTATLMAHQDTEVPTTTPVTFILAGHRLITVRYDEPRPFVIVNHRLERACPVNATGETIMMDILDAVIDRLADVLEHMGNDVEQVSRDIFDPNAPAGDFNNYSRILHTIGKKGDVTSKVRESLVSIGRVLLYLANEADSMKWAKDQRAILKGMQRDVQSLSDHATYISTKIQFLLDAMLGMVSLQQNNIIKIFSVAAVVFMPPTLLASIYGMNFKHMPELDWTYGYPIGLVLMLIAAILPYLFFKWKKWL
jgi:magnesium transporter